MRDFKNKEELELFIMEILEKNKKRKKEAKLTKKENEKKNKEHSIIWRYFQRKDKVLFDNIEKIKIQKENVQTHIEDWEEFKIESPLITKESCIMLFPLLKREIPEIKHTIFSKNYIFRLYLDDNTNVINKNDIPLHIEEGKLNISKYYGDDENREVIIKKIMEFFKKYFNEAIENMEHESPETRKEMLKKIGEMKLKVIGYEQ